MNWFAGTIAEAVNVSKTKNAIFVVYSEGSDELSTAFTSLINDDRVRSKLESDDFVAIKVQSDSEAYKQFAQIYKLVPFPSLFFIGKNGTPIEIVTGITKTVEELQAKIDGVLERAEQSPAATAAAASANLIASERSTAEDAETEVVCENGVCYKRPIQKQEQTPTSTTAPSTSANQSAQSNVALSATEERLRRAKELIDQKRKEKEEEAKKLDKERELQRRRVGQDLQSFKQRQEENELKKLQEERKRDKIEEQAARKRILEQIAQDKAERAQRFNQATQETAPPAQVAPAENRPPVVSDSTVARIQFKKPDGETEVKTFGSAETFNVVRTFVEENVIVGSGIREFALATTFPRKEFKADDNPKTLLELGLAPSSVILILPLDKASTRKLPIQTSYGLIALLTSIFWGIANPLLSTFSYLRARFFSGNRATGAAKRNSENELSPNDVAKRRYLQMNPQQPKEGESSSAYKRVAGSNIHRLNETKDSDDENATWNGNSTQQQ